MKVIIQIPAFNEEKTIGQTLRDLPKKIEGITSVETLVIDDGSIDGTADAARAAGATHVIRLMTHRGLSAAFKTGIDAALRMGADIVVNTDADNQYPGSEVVRLIAPIMRGNAEVVIGDRDVASSPHMSRVKRILQRLGSWTVSRASGLHVADATSGFRAFSREAASQINVFNPFTYTLETLIQSGNHNLGVQSVVIRTNPTTRPSRLYRGMTSYVRKSAATIFRIYTLYKPLKTFFAIGGLLLLAGVLLGCRFLIDFVAGDRGGHVQSLILAAILSIAGFQTMLIGLVADLISVNRRLSEEVLLRLKRLDQPSESKRRPQRERTERFQRPSPSPAIGSSAPASPATAAPAARRTGGLSRPKQAPVTQWVWLLDEAKLDERGGSEVRAASAAEDDDADSIEDQAESTAAPGMGAQRSGPRRRRRRRGGVRQHAELPGNRGKHLGEGSAPQGGEGPE